MGFEMRLPVFLAHGALGAFDELIFAGVAVVFVIMMGVSWVRSRAFEPEWEEDAVEAAPSDDTSEQSDSDERFPLDQ